MPGFNEIIQTPWKYATFTSICFIILLLIIYVWNPFKISNNHPIFTALFLISTLYMIVVGYLISTAHINPRFAQQTQNFSGLMAKAAGALGVVFLLVLIAFIITWLVRWMPGLSVIFNWIYYCLIVIGILGIIYLIFKPTFERMFRRPKETLSLIMNLIFYIPCFLIDFIEFVKVQWKITTKPIWILLFSEIILIGLNFIIPYLFNLLISHDGTHLLDKPIYLNNMKTLGTFENLHAPTDDSEPNFKYHYSISAWFYINPQPPNTRPAYTRFTNILNYGDKPRVEFNGLKNMLRVQVKTSDNNVVTLYTQQSVPMQTWNNIVINYDGGTMDIFLNGKLVSSKPNIAPYMTYENITVGKDKGIEGGICNVVYYNKILSKGDIEMSYKFLNKQNPPVL